MAEGDLITADYQREYRGLLMGPGTVFTIISEEGLLGNAEVRSNDKARGEGHGDFMGQDTHGGRRITVQMTIDTSPGSTVEATIANLMARFQVAIRDGFLEYPYVFQRPGKGKRRVNARPRRSAVVSDYDTARGLAKAVFELYCTDPRVYSNTLSTATITIGTGANSQSGSATMNGTFSDGSPPVLRIDGPFTNPIITNASDGSKAVRLTCTVAGGQHVLIDTNAKTVQYWNGSAYLDRYEWINADSRWFTLYPGANSISYNRSGGGSSSLLTISWRDAWPSA